MKIATVVNNLKGNIAENLMMRINQTTNFDDVQQWISNYFNSTYTGTEGDSPGQVGGVSGYAATTTRRSWTSSSTTTVWRRYNFSTDWFLVGHGLHRLQRSCSQCCPVTFCERIEVKTMPESARRQFVTVTSEANDNANSRHSCKHTYLDIDENTSNHRRGALKEQSLIQLDYAYTRPSIPINKKWQVHTILDVCGDNCRSLHGNSDIEERTDETSIDTIEEVRHGEWIRPIDHTG
eukprot:1636219-Amphidinium_carterae.2